MSDTVSTRKASPLPGRWLVVGGALGGALGAVAGLVVGLCAYPPTAAFAVLELGVPSAIVGGVVGLVAGSIAVLVGRR